MDNLFVSGSFKQKGDPESTLPGDQVPDHILRSFFPAQVNDGKLLRLITAEKSGHNLFRLCFGVYIIVLEDGQFHTLIEIGGQKSGIPGFEAYYNIVGNLRCGVINSNEQEHHTKKRQK